MNFIKIVLLVSLISFFQFTWAKTETDTITNWQLYKDSEILFRSNRVDCYKLTGTVKKTDGFKFLKVVFFRDTRIYGKQKIKFLNDGKVVAEFDYENREELKIPKSKIQSLYKKTGIDLTMMYYDAIESKGIVLGYLRLEN
ncbi:MAG: hypothetical protein CMP76_02440 [Flavobacterium sp.]|uniref:hypothetical protein n=1 Tax=Flavobacterium sp. TaxID=239 RepID=UPI000C6A1152|nr:hypothetical protein [Flavobacterium sp.]MBF02134.1 hypothetical protein [Flavobacterium sp.]